ncbi:MAG: DJ-1/PfpI family protein [Pseudobutyrivibrio sp.]|nr:DJ-1/PfpI family protein [Pseudobutyrivibrio sp.]
MSKVLVFFAEGHEEVEALTVVDLLRRAGIEVDMVSVTGNKRVPGSHGINTYCDQLVETADFDGADMLVLPGGMPGTLNLELCDKLMAGVGNFVESGKLVGAICAAPTVLGRAGYLQGKKATCYPGMEADLKGAIFSQDNVCHDGNIITSRGVGTAIDFALEIITTLVDESTAKNLAKGIVYKV